MGEPSLLVSGFSRADLPDELGEGWVVSGGGQGVELALLDGS